MKQTYVFSLCFDKYDMSIIDVDRNRFDRRTRRCSATGSAKGEIEIEMGMGCENIIREYERRI